MSKPLKLHWSHSKPNFGDALSPLICEAVSGRQVVHAKASQADLIAVGSLLHRLKEHWFSHKVHVWGTGYIEQPHSHRSRHYYHAVRGKLSANALNNQQIVTFGDPGLLSDILLPTSKWLSKKFRIGLVAHYKDKSNPIIKALSDSNDDITVIDIFLPPLEFLKKLCECEIILSSAMHGLIAADALGIPNGWIKLSEGLRGNDFKFHDYYSVFNITPSASTLSLDNVYQLASDIAENYQRENIDVIKEDLLRAFPHSL
jgi:pyruvyltransferase